MVQNPAAEMLTGEVTAALRLAGPRDTTQLIDDVTVGAPLATASPRPSVCG